MLGPLHLGQHTLPQRKTTPRISASRPFVERRDIPQLRQPTNTIFMPNGFQRTCRSVMATQPEDADAPPGSTPAVLPRTLPLTVDTTNEPTRSLFGHYSVTIHSPLHVIGWCQFQYSLHTTHSLTLVPVTIVLLFHLPRSLFHHYSRLTSEQHPIVSEY